MTRPHSSPEHAGRAERPLIVATRFLIDLAYWVEKDPRIALRVIRLVLDIARDPRRGIGKPEPLKHLRAGTWSRRITLEHRMLYLFSEEQIEFISARHHT